MEIFNYDKDTFEFIGSAIADPDPLETGAFLIPMNSTKIDPPTCQKNQVAVFDPAIDDWRIVPDFRGTQYWLDDHSQHTVDAIGVALPTAAILTPPPEPRCNWNNGAWNLPIEIIKSDLSAAVRRDHAQMLDQISGGYTIEERDTWPSQRLWAERYNSDGSFAEFLTELLPPETAAALVEAGHVPAAVMAQKILSKAQAGDLLTAIANRTKNVCLKKIERLETHDQVAALRADLEKILGDALSEYQSKMAAFQHA